MIAELADGRQLEFPDGTDPAVVQATVKRLLSPEASGSAVAINAANKGLAGIPDALLNAPTNVINLGKAAFGTAATMAGRPDLAPDVSPQPDLVRKGFESAGFIKPENEPKDAKQRIIDTLMQGGAGMLASPAKSGGQLISNIIAGLTGGLGAGATKEATGSEPLAIAAGMVTPFAPAAGRRAVVGKQLPMNEVKAKTLEDARDAGYGVPGSETNTGWINRRLESLAGKDAVKQEIAGKNQQATNAGVAEDLGFPKDTALTPAKLEAYRDQHSQPYRDVAALSPAAASNLEKLKEARFNKNAYYTHYERSGDPESLKKAKAYGQQADLLEATIEQIAIRRGQPQLVDELREARRDIAKSYDAERALNLGDANVSAPMLGSRLDKGVPLSGNMKTTAAFAEAFPRYATEGAKIPPAGISKLEAISALGMGSGGVAAFGTPGALLGAIPLMSDPTRKLVTSKAYQRMLSGSGKPLTEQQIQALMLARAIADRNP